MRFLPALLLVVASVHTNSLPYYGWTPGQELTFNYQSQILTGIPEISQSHWSGIRMNAEVIVQSFSDYSLHLKIIEPEFWTINGKDIKLSETGRVMREQDSDSIKVESLPESFKHFLMEPFKVHMKAGVVESLMVGKNEPASITNIKKSILSQIQMNMAGTRPSRLETNQIQLPVSEGVTNEVPYFTTMEESIQGECLTEYNIQRLPEFKINELEEAWHIEELKVKGSNIGSESNAKQACQDKPYFIITKTRNLEKCKKSPFFQMYTGGIVATTGLTSNSELGNTISNTQTYICGEIDKFVIRKVTNTRMVDHTITGYHTEEVPVTSSQVNLSLLKISPITSRMNVPATFKTIDSIVYGFPIEDQQISGEHQLDQEIVEKTEESMGLTPLLPHPTLTQAPHNLLVTLPKETIIPQIFEQIQEIADVVYQSLESSASGSDLAGKLSVLSVHMRSLNLPELEQLEFKVMNSSRSDGMDSLKQIFYDTLSLVGTNPSTMIIIRKVNEGTLPINVLTKLVSHAIRNIRYPTQEIMEELVKMMKISKPHRQMYTSAMLQMSNLFYHAYINPVTMRNNFPTKVFGIFGTKDSTVLTEAFIPFLVDEIERTESEHVRLSAILALGKTGHLKGLKTLVNTIQHLSVPSTATSFTKVEARRVIAVNAMKRMAKMNPTDIRPILMSIITNPVESAEVKIAAVSVLPFAQPTTTEIQTLAVRTWMEPSQQVSSFITSTVRSLAYNQVLELKTVSLKARSVLPLIKDETYGIQKSHNINYSSFVEYLKILVNNQYQLVNSKRSLIPHKLALKTDSYAQSKGFKVNVIDFSAYTFGMDHLLDRYLHLISIEEQTTTPIMKQLDQIVRELKLKTWKPQTSFSFVHGQWAGVEASLYLDTDIVSESIEKLTAKLESGDQSQFNNVGATQIFDSSYMFVTETGFPIMATSTMPIIYSVTGSFKVAKMEGKIVPKVLGKIAPVLNGKLQTHYGLISPFTEEFVGTGVEMCVHASTQIEIEGKMRQGQIEVAIRNPTEVESSRLQTRIHAFVTPYTYKYKLLTVTPVSHSYQLKKIVSGMPREPISFKVGQSLGLSALVKYQTDTKSVGMVSYIQKLIQQGPVSMFSSGLFPSSARMSSFSLEYFPSKSQAKEFKILLGVFTKGMIHSLSQKQISEHQIPTEFSQVKSVLSQLKEANVVEITGVTKSFSGSELMKVKTFVVFGKKSAGVSTSIESHLAAVEVSPITAGENFSLRYEGKIEFPKLKNILEVQKMVNEDLKGGFQGELFYGKTDQMQRIKVDLKLEKTEDLKREINLSPEYKECILQQQNHGLLNPMCKHVRNQAASLDKIRLIIETPAYWANSTFIEYLDGVAKTLTLGNVVREDVIHGNEGVLVVEARADSISNLVTFAKITTPERQLVLRNLRLMGYTKFIFPTTAIRSPLEVAALRLTGNQIPATCSIEPSFVRTFDNMTLNYQINDCEHVLLLDRSLGIPVAVTTRTIESRKKIVKILSGVNEVELIPTTAGKINVIFNGGQLATPAVGEQIIKNNEKGVTQLILQRYNEAVFVHIPEQGLQVLSDGSVIEIVAPQVLKSRTIGLCGNMNGERSANLKTPNMCVLRPQMAAISFMLNKSGANAGFERCAGLPSDIKEEFIRETSKPCPLEDVIPSTLVLELDHDNADTRLNSASAVTMPNIGYVLSGYDIYKGNPIRKGKPDPGFRYPIFRAVYEEGNVTPDNRFKEPNGMSIQSCDGTCVLDFKSSLISGSKSYRKELSNKVSTSFGIPIIASFSASTEFRQVEEKSSEQSTFYTMSEVQCCAYSACLEDYHIPKFDDNFMRGLDTLPVEYDEYKYSKFVENFGTHYIMEAEMGALYGQQSTISKESWYKMKSSGTNIEMAASYSGKFDVSAGVGSESEEAEATAFNKEVEEKTVYSRGEVPTENAFEWAQKVKREPQPVSLKLRPLEELMERKELKEDYFEKKGRTRVLENLKKFLANYCQYLMKRGILSSCDEPPPDQPLPGENCPDYDVNFYDGVALPWPGEEIAKLRTWQECGKLCDRNPTCKGWSWQTRYTVAHPYRCLMKTVVTASGTAVPTPHMVTGLRGCSEFKIIDGGCYKDGSKRAMSLIQTANQGCWNQCGKKSGRCPGFCRGGLCCRQGVTGGGCDGNMGGITYHMCVSLPNPPNTNSYDWSTNSPKACNLHCQGFEYFGLEAGGECYCGNTFDYLIKEPESECTKVCPGDKSKRCGGDWRLNIYRTTDPLLMGNPMSIGDGQPEFNHGDIYNNTIPIMNRGNEEGTTAAPEL